MIYPHELRQMSEARRVDAVNLYQRGRYDAAMYVAGYAVELALKARICETLSWSWFPSTSAEFSSYRSLQTHDLKVLLEFSGIKNRVNSERADAWKAVKVWGPDWRYLPVNSANNDTCSKMIDAVAALLEVI